jgi:hypothetical protein
MLDGRRLLQTLSAQPRRLFFGYGLSMLVGSRVVFHDGIVRELAVSLPLKSTPIEAV